MIIKRYEMKTTYRGHESWDSLEEDEEGRYVDYADYAESERYGRQADITIENLERKVEQFSSASQAALDVLFERQRQVTGEGWTPEHDDEHKDGQLAEAAACYAMLADSQGFSTPAHWPWSPDWWKQSGARRDLVKAGALILAEIERIDRAAGITVKGDSE